MKRRFLFFIFFISFFSSIFLYSFDEKSFNVIQTPSAGTLPRGFFWLNGFMYGGGGVGFNAAIGITDTLTLGLSVPIDHVIGKDAPGWHIPSILFKLRILGSDPSSFHLTIGYGNEGFGDPFYYYEEQAQGPFVAMRKGFLIGGLSQYLFLNFGVRYPILPDKARQEYEVSAYLSLSLDIGEYFTVKAEVSHISFIWARNPIGTLGFAYHFSESFSVELDLGFTGNEQDKFIFDRSLQLAFVSMFY